MSLASDSILARVGAYAQTHAMFAPGPLIVGVSGGIDSLVLLHVLIRLAPRWGLQLFAATFDHRLRGEESQSDLIAVQTIGQAWGVPVISGSEDVLARAQAWRLNLEAAARRARYRFLAATADEVEAKTIAVAHHQDDQAETVLMRLIRGTGLDGLRGMLPRTSVPETNRSDLTLIRPFLSLSRAQISAYAYDHQIEPRYDPSNEDTRYTRNRIRHAILPLMETLNPEVKSALARLAETACDDYAALITLAPPVHMTFEGASISREAFLTSPPAGAALSLRRAAEAVRPEVELSFARLGQIRSWIIRGKNGEQDLSGGLRIGQREGQITIFDPVLYPAAFPSMGAGSRLDLPVPGEYPLPESGWRVRLEVLKADSAPPLDPLMTDLTLPLESRLGLRTFHPGDRFCPQGLEGHSQKLSDTLTNLKVRPVWRDRIPLFTVDEQIVWFVPPGKPPRLAELPSAKGGSIRLRVSFHGPRAKSETKG